MTSKTWSLALPLALLCSSLAAQKLDTAGKAWLAAYSEPSTLNLDGSWQSAKWGTFALHQAQGSRDVTGSGDEWDVTGVVSGDQAYLLFSHKNDVAYAAQLSPDGPTALAGHYAEGIPSSPKKYTRLMHLSRPPGHVAPQDRTVQVIVYRKGQYRGSFVKPSVYCDDSEVALTYSGEYFTIALPPGKHSIASSDELTSVSLDAQAGSTYYVRIGISKSGGFSVEQVDAPVALKELKDVKPAKPNHITKPDFTSASPLAKK